MRISVRDVRMKSALMCRVVMSAAMSVSVLGDISTSVGGGELMMESALWVELKADGD